MSRNNILSQPFFRAFILGLLIVTPALLSAQNRSLPILEENPDARSMAMGNVSLMSTDRNYLYVNPSSIFYSANKYSVSVNGTFFPKNDDDVSGRLLYGNASAAWRFADRHAAFIGYRYLGGETITGVKDQYNTPGDEIKPLDWSFDFGYSFKINEKLSAFARGSIIQQKFEESNNAFSFSLGGNYRTSLNLGSMESQLNIAARVLDLGPAIESSSEIKYDLPTSAQASADLSLPLCDMNELNIAVGGRYFLPSDATLLTVGAGAEYTYNNLVSARAGYNYGENETSRTTVGFGLNINFLSVDAAYSIANDTDFNMFHMGLTARF